MTLATPDPSLSGYREALVAFIRRQAQPPDKFSHQERLYALAREIAKTEPCDDDILFAAAWLHDLGVFVGHRPSDLEQLARWDHVAYAVRETPAVLRQLGFPPPKIPPVLVAIEDHLPSRTPRTPEGRVLRDADILEQLGAVGILRLVSKVGRDTRFPTFTEVLAQLRQNLERLPRCLVCPAAHRLAQPRIAALAAFVQAAETELG